MGRRVWSDPEVIELSRNFVTVADEVWRLQRDDDPECHFFRQTVKGNVELSRGSMQGTYVLTAGGTLLARKNTSNPAAVAELLKGALARWEELPAEARQLRDDNLVASGFRWEQLAPPGGLFLRRTGRDLPADGDPSSKPGDRFNREAVWFSAQEARSMVPEDRAVGARRLLPELITKRFGCLVFVDNIRGQTIPYHPTEDGGSQLWCEVTKVEGEQLHLRISGHTAAIARGPWLFETPNDWIPKESRRYPHSIATRVLGAAVWDTDSSQFLSFDLLALGQRQGRTINNGRRGSDQEVSGVGFVCELAPRGWRIPPTFIDVYGVDWAGRP